uniref:Uncharacterized protein n=1 Tax=Nelumbo nucifera TaxID=4432 RepID=A0A822Y7E9_NELNU|nr:TPA_asm: hypothetical protein HUJ06_028413 [Nelumbo nucifera]
MGCTQSRIETEEAVIRCKERKQFMREAVSKRNAFAAAHVAYSVSLKSTGGALTDYAQCQVQDPRPHQPVIQPPMETLPPPPPLPDFNPPAPLLRAATMPEFSIPRVDPKPADPIQEEDEAEVEEEINLIRRGSRSAARTSETAVPPRPRSPPPPPRSPPRAPPPDNSVPAPQESENSTWDYFFSVEIPAPSLSEVEEISPEKKEGDGDGHDNRSSKKENVVADGDTESKVEPQTPEKVIETPVKPEKQQKQVVRSHAASSEAKKVSKVPNMNLFQILSKIDDHFLKASESAREVSTMLEANRFHYHSNFADNRGHIDHSKRVMRAITWNRSFKGLANADDEKDELDFDDNETHASVLDKLLAWEKKLYDEVKAGELMKLDYRKKVALLNKQKKRGTNPETLEKAKAAYGQNVGIDACTS